MPEVVDIAEESARHKDEWLLFEVVETDQLDQPVRGRMLCHSKSREVIHEEVMKHPDLPLQWVFTGDPFPQGVEVIL